MRGAIMVMSGADGVYRFDKVAPDQYLVTAMVTSGGMMEGGGASMESELVRVDPGQPAQRDVDVPEGTLKVAVTVTQAGASLPTNAQVFLFSGVFKVKRAAELFTAIAERGKGSMQPGFQIKGKPASFSKVKPGETSVCVIPFDCDLNDATCLAKLQEDVDSLPVHCQTQTLAASPTSQTVTVTVPAAPAK
jgi:hypothetical protein